MPSGYLMKGQCFPSLSAAADAWASDYPKHDGIRLYQLSAAPAVDTSAGSVTVAYSVATLDGSAPTASEMMTLVPPACEAGAVQIPAHSFLLVVVACVVLFALGFNAGRG